MDSTLGGPQKGKALRNCPHPAVSAVPAAAQRGPLRASMADGRDTGMGLFPSKTQSQFFPTSFNPP